MRLRAISNAAALLLLVARFAVAQTQQDTLTQCRALLQSGNIAAAEPKLRAWLQDNRNSAEGHFLLGYTLFRQQRAKDSLAEFTAGARFQRPSPGDLKVVAADYVLLGDFADAEKWLTLVTQEAPQDANAWYLLGRAQYNENRFADAIQSFTHTLALEPYSVKAENNLGLSYEGLGQHSQAQSAYATAIAWQRGQAKQSAQPWLNLGSLLIDEDQPAKALDPLKRAVALAPANPKAHEQLGRAYQALQKLSEAQAELERAATLAPNASGLHFKLGQIYRREGLAAKAKQEFDRCAQLDSTHSSIDTPNPAEQ